MRERLEQELALLRQEFRDLEFEENEGLWIRVPDYPIAIPDWNRQTTDVAFQVLVSYPGTPPYGIYVPVGLRWRGEIPGNYTEPAPTQPPFLGGPWAVFSWTPQERQWRPTADLVSGSNLLNVVRSFRDRFREGR